MVNSVAARFLDRLAVLAHRPDFREKAEIILDLPAPKAANYGLFAAAYGLAVTNHFRPPVELVVVGSPADERTKKLLKSAYQAPRAGKRVLTLEPQAVKARDIPAGLAATSPVCRWMVIRWL